MYNKNNKFCLKLLDYTYGSFRATIFSLSDIDFTIATQDEKSLYWLQSIVRTNIGILDSSFHNEKSNEKPVCGS